MQNWNQWQLPTGTVAASIPQPPVGYQAAGSDPMTMMQQYMQYYSQPAPSGYTPEQWAAAQQQNWAQWQQWQQQYQQWQSQYGDKYQETMKHYQTQAQPPPLPSTQPPPPPKDDSIKPPLPPDNSNMYNFTTMPPPHQNNLPLFPSKQTNSGQAQDIQTYSQNPPSSLTNPSAPANKNTRTVGEKSCANSTIESESAKKMKLDEEKLIEIEKTFDAQFKQWEEQFNTWKQKNANHPDKEQYKQYEAKWTSWREKLLERREQMRRKREQQKQAAKAEAEKNKDLPGGDKILNILSNTENQGLINNLLGIGKTLGLTGKQEADAASAAVSTVSSTGPTESAVLIGPSLPPVAQSNAVNQTPTVMMGPVNVQPPLPPAPTASVPAMTAPIMTPDMSQSSWASQQWAQYNTASYPGYQVPNVPPPVVPTHYPPPVTQMPPPNFSQPPPSMQNFSQPPPMFNRVDAMQTSNPHVMGNHNNIRNKIPCLPNDMTKKPPFQPNRNTFEQPPQSKTEADKNSYNSSTNLSDMNKSHGPAQQGNNYNYGNTTFNNNKNNFTVQSENVTKDNFSFNNGTSNNNCFGSNENQFGPSNDRFGPNNNCFGSSGDRFGPNNTDRFGRNNDNFGSNNNRFGNDRSGNSNLDSENNSFGASNDRFGPNHDRLGSTNDRFGPYNDRFNQNNDCYGSNNDRRFGSDDRFKAGNSFNRNNQFEPPDELSPELKKLMEKRKAAMDVFKPRSTFLDPEKTLNVGSLRESFKKITGNSLFSSKTSTDFESKDNINSRNSDISGSSFGPGNRGSVGPRDSDSEPRPPFGLRCLNDFGPRGPRDFSLRSSNDFGPRGPNDCGPRGPNDFGPRGPNDFGPRGPNDFGPRGPNDFIPRGSSDFSLRCPNDFGLRGPTNFGPNSTRPFLGSGSTSDFRPPGPADYVQTRPEFNPNDQKDSLKTSKQEQDLTSSQCPKVLEHSSSESSVVNSLDNVPDNNEKSVSQVSGKLEPPQMFQMLDDTKEMNVMEKNTENSISLSSEEPQRAENVTDSQHVSNSTIPDSKSEFAQATPNDNTDSNNASLLENPSWLNVQYSEGTTEDTPNIALVNNKSGTTQSSPEILSAENNELQQNVEKQSDSLAKDDNKVEDTDDIAQQKLNDLPFMGENDPRPTDLNMEPPPELPNLGPITSDPPITSDDTFKKRNDDSPFNNSPIKDKPFSKGLLGDGPPELQDLPYPSNKDTMFEDASKDKPFSKGLLGDGPTDSRSQMSLGPRDSSDSRFQSFRARNLNEKAFGMSPGSFNPRNDRSFGMHDSSDGHILPRGFMDRLTNQGPNNFAPRGVDNSSLSPRGMDKPPFGSHDLANPSFGPRGMDRPPCGPRGMENSPCGPRFTNNPPYGPRSIDSSPFGPRGMDNPPFGSRGIDNSPFGPRAIDNLPFGPRGVNNPPFGLRGADNSPFGSRGLDRLPFDTRNNSKPPFDFRGPFNEEFRSNRPSFGDEFQPRGPHLPNTGSKNFNEPSKSIPSLLDVKFDNFKPTQIFGQSDQITDKFGSETPLEKGPFQRDDNDKECPSASSDLNKPPFGHLDMSGNFRPNGSSMSNRKSNFGLDSAPGPRRDWGQFGSDRLDESDKMPLSRRDEHRLLEPLKNIGNTFDRPPAQKQGMSSVSSLDDGIKFETSMCQAEISGRVEDIRDPSFAENKEYDPIRMLKSHCRDQPNRAPVMDFHVGQQFNYNHGGINAERKIPPILEHVPAKVIDYGHVSRKNVSDHLTPVQSFDYGHGNLKPNAPEHEIYPRRDFRYWEESEQNLREYTERMKVYEFDSRRNRSRTRSCERNRMIREERMQHVRDESYYIEGKRDEPYYKQDRSRRSKDRRDNKDYKEKRRDDHHHHHYPRDTNRSDIQENKEEKNGGKEDYTQDDFLEDISWEGDNNDRNLTDVNSEKDNEDERSNGNNIHRDSSQEIAETNEVEMSTLDNDKNVCEPPTHPSTTIEISKPSNCTMVDDILCQPGRQNRAPKIAIILRGPPGSGKSFVAKLIKDKEVEQGGSAPRILSLDDYFLVENEVETTDDNGKKVTVKEMVYEYEEAMEPSYTASLLKAFKKNITDGFFNFIIVDSINEKISDYEEMWSFAKSKGFRVYVCEMEMDVQVCLKRNIHNRTEDDINKIVDYFEPTPSYHQKIDVNSMLQEQAIEEVQMEDSQKNDTTTTKIIEDDQEDSQDDSQASVGVSKWERMEAENKLDRLDGLAKRKQEKQPQTMEDFLQVPDYYNMEDDSGRKRVRWADLEERKEQEKMRRVGFVVGHTNWERMMDPTKGSSALTRTKYI